MPRISNFQIFVILFNLIVPLSFFVTSKIIIRIMLNNSWIPVIAAILPGIILVYLYMYILNKSEHPFPILLEDHLGKIAGRLLGVIYGLVFMIGTVIHLRLFADFMENNVIFGIPIGVVIAVMLMVSYYALYKGLEVFSKVLEILFVFGVTLALLMVVIGIAQDPSFENLKPIQITSMADFFNAFYQSFWILGNMIIILTLAFFSNERSQISRVLAKTVGYYIFFICAAIMLAVISLGTVLNLSLIAPIYSISRAIEISDFIRNAEVVFISSYIVGLFSSITIQWFMSCYVLQQSLKINDFRFMMGPMALIIAFLSIKLTPNIIFLYQIWERIAPVLFGFFYILIPFFLAVILLFKPRKGLFDKPDLMNKEAIQPK